jgi:biotin carboxylase
VAQTEKIKRKSEMKKIFKAAGAPVVEGEIVKDQKSLQKFIKKHGYPVFTKPDVGVGGTRTFTIFNEEDVNTFWKYKPDFNYLWNHLLTAF